MTTPTPMLMMRNSRKNAPCTWLARPNAAAAVSDSLDTSHMPKKPTPKPKTSSASKGQATASRCSRLPGMVEWRFDITVFLN
jgi:hypothetical protein